MTTDLPVGQATARQPEGVGRHLPVTGPFAIKGTMTGRSYLAVAAASFSVILLVWSVLTYGEYVKPFFLPTPTAVLAAIRELFVEYDLLADIRISFYRVGCGYGLAIILAVPLGLLVGSFKFADALISPVNDFMRYMPVPAFVPLTILWIGVDDSSQIALIFMGTFFQLLVLVADATAQVPREYLEASYTLGASRRGALWDVVWPYSFPLIFDCMRVAFGWAWSYLLLAEVVGASTGLGHKIMESQRYLRTPNVIGAILIIGVIGLVVDLLFKMTYSRMFRWTEKT